MKLVHLAGKTYAAGLWWQIRSGGPAPARQMLNLAREQAKQESEKYTHVVLRADQFGLGCHTSEIPAKTLSLAASLRNLDKADAFIGVFCLGDFWWVCGIVRGIIAADGDNCFTTREEAVSAATSLRNLITDVSEKIFETLEDSNQFLLPRLLTDAYVVALFPDQKKRTSLAYLALAIILSGLALIAANHLYEAQRAKEERRIADIKRRQLAAQRQDQIEHPEKYFRQLWLDKPLLLPSAKQCVAEILAQPVSVNGWLFEDAQCFPSSFTQISWKHTNQADFLNLPPGAKLSNPQTAVRKKSLPNLPRRNASQQLLDRGGASARVYNLAQKLSCRATLECQPPEQFQVDEKTVIYAPWQTCEFVLSELPMAAFLERDLFDALSFPGAAVSSISLKNKIWSIKGVVYAFTQ